MAKRIPFFVALSLAAAPFANAQGASGGGAGMTQLFIILLMFGGMYFLIIAPQRKRQKQQEAMIAALKPGDRVVTSGGIHGQITNVKDTSVILRVADDVKIEVSKPSIGTKLSSDGAADGN